MFGRVLASQGWPCRGRSLLGPNFFGPKLTHLFSFQSFFLVRTLVICATSLTSLCLLITSFCSSEKAKSSRNLYPTTWRLKIVICSQYWRHLDGQQIVGCKIGSSCQGASGIIFWVHWLFHLEQDRLRLYLVELMHGWLRLGSRDVCKTSSQSSEMRSLSPNLKLWMTHSLTARRCYRISKLRVILVGLYYWGFRDLIIWGGLDNMWFMIFMWYMWYLISPQWSHFSKSPRPSICRWTQPAFWCQVQFWAQSSQ